MLCTGFRLLATARQFNMAMPAFAAMGAYTVAILTTKEDWNFWPSLVIGGMVAATVALILGVIVLRIKGVYFAFLTFSLSIFVQQVFIMVPSLFGGTQGISHIPPPQFIGGWEFGSVPSFYYLGLCLALPTLLLMYRLDRARFGMVLRSIGRDDTLSESVGVNIMAYKITAFAIAAFFAGLAGGYFAVINTTVEPFDFTLAINYLIIIYAVVGSLVRFMGPVYGVVALIAITGLVLPEIPGYDPKIEPILLGGSLILVMIFAPGGVASLVEKVSASTKGLWRKWIKDHANA